MTQLVPKPVAIARWKGRGNRQLESSLRGPTLSWALGGRPRCPIGCWLLSLGQSSRLLFEGRDGYSQGQSLSQSYQVTCSLGLHLAPGGPASGPLPCCCCPLNHPKMTGARQGCSGGGMCLQGALSWEDRWQTADTCRYRLHFLP